MKPQVLYTNNVQSKLKQARYLPFLNLAVRCIANSGGNSYTAHCIIGSRREDDLKVPRSLKVTVAYHG